jgi:hypothetical protein
MAKVFFIFSVGLVPNFAGGIESPKAFYSQPPFGSYDDVRGRYSMDVLVWRLRRIRTACDEFGDVLFVDLEFVAGQIQQDI